MSHVAQLQKHIPDLLDRVILDVGSGRGKFLRWIKDLGGTVIGLEPYSQYIEMTRDFSVVQGTGEAMPFAGNFFGFLNIAEVIEHCEDPKKLLSEAHRVLQKGGAAYISFPNRFGIKDQHYHLWLINWLPRFLIPYLIKEKESGSNGRQKLTEMHYFTYWGARNILKESGFNPTDTRLSRIPKCLVPLYYLFAPFTFDAHHFIAHKI